VGKSVKVERDGRVLIVTLDRPKVLNSLDAAACRELSSVWDEFQADPELWVGIITGAGEKAFCAGHDLANDPYEPMPPTGWAGISERTDLTKPIIAAVNGYALGGGFEIVLACDIVIADERASFALSEPRVGGFAGGGGADRLCLRIPSAVAMGLLLTGRRIGAAEAHRWGLVTEVVAAGEALLAARRWADQILTCAPHAVRLTKQLAMEALEWREMSKSLIARRHAVWDVLKDMEDTREGFAAFLEKRKPVWRGR
jgi:enoyl-CoA hydratase/carnithine racemase